MKVCCIIYHSNIYEKYNKEWIIDFLKSIYIQTYQDFDIVECNYDNSNLSLINSLRSKKLFIEKKCYFINHKFENQFSCLNYLLKYVFEDLNYDVCINTNVDDIYSYNRFEKQIQKIKEGYDLVSSNYKIFQKIKDNTYEREINLINKDISTDYKKRLFFTNMTLEKKNVLPFSSTTFTKKCWEESNKNLQYPETLCLMKSLLKQKIKVDICEEFLLEHRIHNEQYSNIFKDKII